MADCAGQVLQVAVYEDGHASVQLPVDNWRDVKGVHTVGQYAGVVNALHADSRVDIYGGPSGAMVDVCIEFLSDDEKKARDDAEREAAEASVAEVHDARIADASDQVTDASLAQKSAEEAAEDEARAEAADKLAAAERALEDAYKARDNALEAVRNGG